MCEIIVHAAPFDIAAQAENSSEGHAFDKALKAVQRQIKDSKDRMVQRGRRSRRGSAANASGLAEAV
jgi:ribosome-associated translation inhibitor RaiA